jgi:hypothetical protein
MHTVRGVYDGQVIRPTEPVRAQPSTKVIIIFLEGDTPPSPFKVTRLEDVAGCLSYSGPAKTLEEMQEAVARRARER